MEIQAVCAVYFSATGTTKKVVTQVARRVASQMAVPYDEIDFTLPPARENTLLFQKKQLVIFGVPVYAGRVPNVLLPFLRTCIGNNALAVPVVLYGNREYDDALIELRDLLEQDGFHTIAAGAFVGEHAFSYTLAAGRPDASDLAIADQFADKIADYIAELGEIAWYGAVAVKGQPYPYRKYYQPRDRKGVPVDIRKVKPVTNAACNHCGKCATVCPMGSIDRKDVGTITKICIKCGACIKACPVGAKYYEDSSYLYHKKELELGFARRAEPELFYKIG